MASPSGGDAATAARCPYPVRGAGPALIHGPGGQEKRKPGAPEGIRPDGMRSRMTSRLYGFRLAGGEAFDEPELEPLASLDVEAFGADQVEGAAQEVLSLQRHGDGFGGPLDGADRPGGPG